MAEARVKAGIWVSMALRLGNASGRYGAVLRKGDPDAGGVLVVLHGQQGLSVLSQIRTADGVGAWIRGTGPGPVAQEVATKITLGWWRSQALRIVCSSLPTPPNTMSCSVKLVQTDCGS